MTEIINGIGRGFCDYAAAMFIQVNVLIVVLLGVDLFLRNRIRATLRYWIWMLVFVKLLLPPSLCVPTGIGYWLGRNELLTPSGSSRPIEAVAAPVRMELETPIETPPVQESRPFPLTVEPAQAVSVAAERLVWQGGVFLLWGAGVSVFAALVIQRLLFVRGLIAHTEPARSDLTDVLDECRRRMGIRRSVGLRLSSGAFSPAVCGLFRPTILMPAAMLDRLSPEGLRAVLIHELAHVKRGDLWVNTLQTVLQIVYFYNPLVWLANAIVRRVREQAVDEMVLVALDAQARSYGNTLIDIAEMAFLRASPALRLIGVAESRKSLEGRIKHMMTRPIPKSARVGALGVLAVAVTGAVLLPMARAQSRTAPEADGEYKILLLDDRDDQYDGKYVYDDRLYLMDSKGRVEGAVTGFNISQAAGGCHVLAVDEKGKTLWVVENVGGRLWHFDLANGKLLHQVSLPHINAAAVDPVTGNVWCTISGEFIHEGRLQVVSPTGEMLMTYPIPGYDIACSDLDDSFWVVGKTVSRVSKDGRVLSQTAGEVSWLAVSVSVDQKTGTAWVVVRDHPDIPGSRPELWAVDKNARIQQQIDLGDLLPYCVVVDSGNGIVWIGCLGVTLRYTTQGEKLK
ncbi:MAG: M56 family metallopeptidase, partial [Phycisphaerales bacterium]